MWQNCPWTMTRSPASTAVRLVPCGLYLARVSGDPALADDLMQESYVRYLCASQPASLALEGEVAARRYLFRIATNLLRDHWRRPHSTSIEELPEEFFAASASSAQADSQAVLGPALAQMRPLDRQLLWLRPRRGLLSSRDRPQSPVSHRPASACCSSAPAAKSPACSKIRPAPLSVRLNESARPESSPGL